MGDTEHLVLIQVNNLDRALQPNQLLSSIKCELNRLRKLEAGMPLGTEYSVVHWLFTQLLLEALHS